MPTIWTTNSLSGIDLAVLRRLTYVLEVGELPRSLRKSFLTKNLAGMEVADAWKNRVSQNTCLTPALVEQMGELTPGDFAVIHRKWRLSGEEASQDNLLSALIHEVECKNVHKGRPIGFL